MISFACDYLEGACPEIIKKLAETNMEQTAGYGQDEYCEKAREYIKKELNCDSADIHFLVGGTQTNTTVIASVLKPYQGVISAVTGHINVHETGAIESTGHKVLTVDTPDGKLKAEEIDKYFSECDSDPNYEHIVQPKMVYISNPTETGMLYTKAELEDISRVCKKNKLVLFLDGARLGYALASKANDITLADYAKFCDIFYIGGTKCGALFGEAVVIVNDEYKKDFRSYIKQRGAMLAKGIQFAELFRDGLYFKICRHAMNLAEKVKDGFSAKGYEFLFDSDTNQQFPVILDDKLEELSQKYIFEFWKKVDDKHTAVRVCTSWATKEENVERLLEDL